MANGFNQYSKWEATSLKTKYLVDLQIAIKKEMTVVRGPLQLVSAAASQIIAVIMRGFIK